MPILSAIRGTGTTIVGTSALVLNNLRPETLNFINRQSAGGYNMSVTEINAINYLVDALYGAGLWTLLDFIHPIIGNSTATCGMDLKNAFNCTFFGSWTVVTTGMRPTAANVANYALTGYTPSVNGLLNDAHMGVYIRTSSGSSAVPMGAFDGVNFHQINATTTAGGGSASVNTALAGVSNPIGLTDSRGHWIINRTSSTNQQLWIRGLLNNNSTSNSAARTTVQLGYGARNRGATRDFPSGQEIAFGHGGKTLSRERVRALNTIVQAYQTMLGRQITI